MRRLPPRRTPPRQRRPPAAPQQELLEPGPPLAPPTVRACEARVVRTRPECGTALHDNFGALKGRASDGAPLCRASPSAIRRSGSRAVLRISLGAASSPHDTAPWSHGIRSARRGHPSVSHRPSPHRRGLRWVPRRADDACHRDPLLVSLRTPSRLSRFEVLCPPRSGATSMRVLYHAACRTRRRIGADR